MESVSVYRAQDEFEPLPEFGCQTACPLCGGAVIPLGAVVQCSRCRHMFCAGCEPDRPND